MGRPFIHTGPIRVLENQSRTWLLPRDIKDIIDVEFYPVKNWRDIGASKWGFRIIDDVIEVSFAEIILESLNYLFGEPSLQLAILYMPKDTNEVKYYHFPLVTYLGPIQPDPGEASIPVGFKIKHEYKTSYTT